MYEIQFTWDITSKWYIFWQGVSHGFPNCKEHAPQNQVPKIAHPNVITLQTCGMAHGEMQISLPTHTTFTWVCAGDTRFEYETSTVSSGARLELISSFTFSLRRGNSYPAATNTTDIDATKPAADAQCSFREIVSSLPATWMPPHSFHWSPDYIYHSNDLTWISAVGRQWKVRKTSP